MEHKIDEKKQGGYYLKQFVVVGGDLRCHYLVLYLKEQGYPVFTWKVPELADTGEKLQDIIGNLKTDDTLKETGLLLPVPVTKDGIHINGCSGLTAEALAFMVGDFGLVCGGVISQELTKACAESGIPCHDYMKDDCVALKNAVATAEGAITESFMMSDINIENSKCLVTGYGRCGRVLAQKLLRMGAEVTVTARSVEACIKAAMGDCHTILLNQLASCEKPDTFDFCYNTIPAPVLDRAVLSKLRPDVVILDIASKPGGTDFAYLDEQGICYKHSLGIPGRYSPKTSGEILGEAVLSYL